MSNTTLGSRSSHQDQLPLVSAVVVNFNGGDCLINCIRALYQQKIPLETITVVDNGSTDSSPDRIRTKFPDVQLLEIGKNRGPSVARNMGLKFATTELVLLIDHDLYVAEECLYHLMQIYQQGHPTVICPRILLLPGRDIIQADGAAPHFIGTLLLRHGFQSEKNAPSQTAVVSGCPSGTLLVHRERVLAAGGFDEGYFFYFEDLEFSVRLRALGHHIICEPAAVVYHDRGLGTPDLAFRGQGEYPSRRAYLTTRNRLTTILIHYRLRTVVVLIPALLLYELATLVIVLIRGWSTEWFRAWLWQLTNIQSIWQRRQRAQQSRLLSDKELLDGGPLPLAPGLVRSPVAKVAIGILTVVLNGYWQIAKNWIA